MSFSNIIDEIIDSIIAEYAKIGSEDTPQSIRAFIRIPMMQYASPSFIMNICLVNSAEQTYAVIKSWSVCRPELNDITTIAANLLSLGEFLDEYFNEDEEDEDEQN